MIAANSQPGGPPPRLTTILLVDDEEKIRRVLALGLRGRGFHVLEAKDGPQALQLSQAHPAPIHLLLVDVVMPGMTGLELAPLILTQRPDIKVILMSGYRNDQICLNAALNPNTPFFHKPFTIDALVQTIHSLVSPSSVP